MKRILVITWFYPPVNSSEGIVTYKLLNNSKFEYDVYTQKNSASWSYGKEDYLKNNKNIHCIYSNSDNLKDWKKEAIKYFKENKEKYDIVMTRSMPPESHEIGNEIKKIKPSIKWIASFGDPIANNPYTLLSKNPYALNENSSLKHIINPIRILKSILYQTKLWVKRKFKDSKIEKRTMKYCDTVIFNSNEQRDYMLNGKEKENIVLAHSYEEELFEEVKNKDKNKKITIAYIGHLDQIRTPRIFLQAINELKQEDKDLENKLEIDFYGNLDREDKLYIFDNQLYDVVKYKNQVTYLESLKKMQEVDYLLHIDANLSGVVNENIFFAAKLADYIGSRTPIISITMLEGASANILRKVGALVLTYSVSDVKNYLRKIIYQNYKLSLNEEKCKEYSAKVVAGEFDEYIEKTFIKTRN